MADTTIKKKTRAENNKKPLIRFNRAPVACRGDRKTRCRKILHYVFMDFFTKKLLILDD